MSGASKPKRNACEGCYRSRVKCEYRDSDGKRCARCKKQNRECIPRVIVRGHAKDDKGPGLNELDLKAYRSAAIFEDLPHLSLHVSAASSLVETYKSLGLKAPPRSLQWMINSMYLVAATEKSIGMLHTSTTLAVSTNTPIDVTVLNQEHSPLSEEVKHELEDQVHADFLRNRQGGACFILRIDGGDRAILANQEFEFFFESAESMAARLSRSPHFRLWRQFMVDDHDSDEFTSKMVKAWLLAGEPKGLPPAIRWSCSSSGEVKIRDSQGNMYIATLFEYGLLAGDGFLGFLVFGFKDMKPLSKAGEERVSQFKAEFPENINQKTPTLTRLDSLWSMLLPEPEQRAALLATQGRPSAPPSDLSEESPTGDARAKEDFAIFPPGHPTAAHIDDSIHSSAMMRAGPHMHQPMPVMHPLMPQRQQQPQPQQAHMHQQQPLQQPTQTQSGLLPTFPESANAKPDLCAGRPAGSTFSTPVPDTPAHTQGVAAAPAPAGPNPLMRNNSLGIPSVSFEWPKSTLVKMDSEDLWMNMDRVIHDLGGEERLKSENWRH